ncbi:hypothetical protein M427DRAFT_62607 [Gonapodya prolifera JEL478]|uniref:Aminoglycoside phosphotransferase domain-containing protein n=1 Tax=Gonapodya prolifera (strain JEL478) TaxID=1344416 RepID=A0A139A093_GONPJ|nr:hypothetical protein M427DRAFT_62607 [Gonapodya prolifera JEL478]|eukprot:KXS10197.1 hypothetical protein M427DRAFT_62607 [Gonapodya prolifera JEL478]
MSSAVPELGQATLDAAPQDLNVDVVSGFVKATIPGACNPTFKLTDARGTQLVLRRKPPSVLVSSTAYQIDREFLVLAALGRNFYPRQLATWRGVHTAQKVIKYPNGCPVPQIDRFEDMAWLQRKMIVLRGEAETLSLIRFPLQNCNTSYLRGASTIGHPLADLAFILGPFFIHPIRGQAPSPDCPLIAWSQFPRHDPIAYMRAYCEAAGWSFEKTWAEWEYVMTFQRLKGAVIAHGIALRGATGAVFADSVPGIVREALEYVDGGDLATKGKL